MDQNPYESPRSSGTADPRPTPATWLANALRIALGGFCILFGVAWFFVIVWLLLLEGLTILFMAIVNLIIVFASIRVGYGILQRGIAGMRSRKITAAESSSQP